MAIVGFEFNKIEAEKKTGVKGGVNIKNNVAIKSVDQVDLKLGGSKQSAAKFGFEYETIYEPNAGNIKLKGTVTYMGDTKIVDAAVADWKKSKKIDTKLMTLILNRVLAKANIQTLLLSDTVNLPPQIPMPKVKTEAKAPAKK